MRGKKNFPSSMTSAWRGYVGGMETTDYDMIHEFAIIHFPSNTVSRNRQGEGLKDEREKKIAQPDREGLLPPLGTGS